MEKTTWYSLLGNYSPEVWKWNLICSYINYPKSGVLKQLLTMDEGQDLVTEGLLFCYLSGTGPLDIVLKCEHFCNCQLRIMYDPKGNLW